MSDSRTCVPRLTLLNRIGATARQGYNWALFSIGSATGRRRDPSPMGLSVAPSPYRATLLLLALVRRNPQPCFSTLLASQPLSKAKLSGCLVPAFDGSDRGQNAQAVRATPAVERVGREALESAAKVCRQRRSWQDADAVVLFAFALWTTIAPSAVLVTGASLLEISHHRVRGFPGS